jgi:hypothetical protein
MKMYIGLDNNFYIKGTSACIKIITNVTKSPDRLQRCVSRGNILKNGLLIIEFTDSTVNADNTLDGFVTSYTGTNIGFISVIPTTDSYSQPNMNCNSGYYNNDIQIFYPATTYKPVTEISTLELDENNSFNVDDDNNLVLSSWDTQLVFMLNNSSGDYFRVIHPGQYMYYNSDHEWGTKDT